MHIKGPSPSFNENQKLFTRNPRTANSEKWASVRMISSLTAFPKIRARNSVKNPLVSEDSAAFCADRQKIKTVTEIKSTAETEI